MNAHRTWAFHIDSRAVGYTYSLVHLIYETIDLLSNTNINVNYAVSMKHGLQISGVFRIPIEI